MVRISLPISSSSMTDQCAQDADGNLLPASAIPFFHSPSDKVPISGPGAAETAAEGMPAIQPLFSCSSHAHFTTGRGQRKKNPSRMKDIIMQELEDEDGNATSAAAARRTTAPQKKKVKRNTAGMQNSDDDDDGIFEGDSDSSSGDSVDETETEIDNEEVSKPS